LLILWNDNPYKKTLSVVFGDENVVCSHEAFLNALKRTEESIAFIVLCELDWFTGLPNEHTPFADGVQIAKELRRVHNNDRPILFVSFLPLKILLNTETEIITAIGHAFCQLPQTPTQLLDFAMKEFYLNETKFRLSSLELNDIKSFYCSKEGILSHEIHYLNKFLNFEITKSNRDEIYNELQTILHRIHQLFLIEPTVESLQFKNLFADLSSANLSAAIKFITDAGRRLNDEYGVKIGIKTREAISYNWEVLLLDDEINKQHPLVQHMLQSGLQVTCCNNAEAALRILQQDWQSANRIMVVIADYRLYEEKGGIRYHQKKQGYEFLRQVALSDQLVRLVAFSGLQRKFLLNSFKFYNIRTEVKSKVDYLADEHTYQLFTDEIIELAEENKEAIEEMPSKCAGFEKSLKAAYKEIRNHPGYYKIESRISLTAKEYVRQLQQQLELGNEMRINAIENIKSPLAPTRKDEEAFLNRVVNYFVARRVALWLHASNKHGLLIEIDSRKIAEVLTDQKYPTNAYRQVLSTNLGLSLEDFPRNITIEERRWLHYEMQLDILRDIRIINPVLLQIANIYKDFISTVSFITKRITFNGYQIIYKYKQANYAIHFTEAFFPEIKTATDIRVIFLIIEDAVQSEKMPLDFMKPLVSRLRLSLFEKRFETDYLKNIFRYFNEIYGWLDKESGVLSNPSQKISKKENFKNRSASSLNDAYERVFHLLLNHQLPANNDGADVWDVFCVGEIVAKEIGILDTSTKVVFFKALSQAINNENKSIGELFNENSDMGRDREDDYHDN
jgi:CheY-like chemotaxis protein